MKIFSIAFILTFIFAQLVFASQDKNDKVFLSKNKVISCKLLLKGDKQNAYSIEYIDEEEQKQIKKASEIFGFQTNPGDVYMSKELDLNGENQHYFCELFTSGYAELFTVYIDEEFMTFIEVQGEEPVLLKKGLEVNTLSFLLKDCEKMTQEYVASSNPTQLENLAKLVVEYSDCMDSSVDNKVINSMDGQKVKLHPGVFLGLDYSSLKNKVSDKNYGKEFNVVFGINCDIAFSKSFTVSPALIYSNIEYATSKPYPVAPEMTLYENFTLSRIQGELAFKFYLGYTGVKPYFSVSPLFTIAGDVKLQKQVIDGNGNEFPLTNDNAEYYTVGGRTAVGVKLPLSKISSFGELRYSYEQINPKPGEKNWDEFALSSLQFVVGVSF